MLLQKGQLPGVFLSIIDSRFFIYFNICPPIFKSSSIFTIMHCIKSYILFSVLFKCSFTLTIDGMQLTLRCNLVIFKQSFYLLYRLLQISLHSNLVIFKSSSYNTIYSSHFKPHFCLPIYLQVQNNYLLYSLLLLNINSHLPLFYNLWAFFDMLPQIVSFKSIGNQVLQE